TGYRPVTCAMTKRAVGRWGSAGQAGSANDRGDRCRIVQGEGLVEGGRDGSAVRASPTLKSCTRRSAGRTGTSDRRSRRYTAPAPGSTAAGTSPRAAASGRGDSGPRRRQFKLPRQEIALQNHRLGILIPGEDRVPLRIEEPASPCQDSGE